MKIPNPESKKIHERLNELENRLNIMATVLEQLEKQSKNCKPLLTFRNTGKDSSGENTWLLRNSSPFPALNVTISCSNEFKVWHDEDTYLFPSIFPNDVVALKWISRAGALVAIYSDAEGYQYTTTCVRNENTIVPGNSFPELKAHKYEWQLPQSQLTL